MHTRSNFLLLCATALAALTLSIGPAAAQTVQTEKLHVEASIGEVCTVTSATLDFGPYEGATLNATGSIEINCLAPTTLSVALDGGMGPHNGAGLRHMLNGSDQLPYNLFTNAPGGNAWETDQAVPATVTGTQSVPVYGVVPGLLSGLANGLYSDEVTITLIF